jgi:hypothetical protein
MFIKIYKLLAVIAFFSMLNGLQAQEAMTAAGGNITGNSGSIDYSIGQIFYTANSGSNGTVEEGVQQPYEIWVYSGIEETNGIQLECLVFPNPVSDMLTLQIKDFENLKLSFQLYDAKGKILENNKVENEETHISTKNLSSGTYFLKVVSNEKEVKSFKIIKY